MATTINSLVTTQLNDGTFRVHVTASIVNAASLKVGLAYQFKHVTDAAWQVAVTNGPASITATPGGAALDFYWDLDASSLDTTTTANFNFRIVTTDPPVAATGTFVAVAANATTGIKDGDTLTVAGRTYEFDSTGSLANAANVLVNMGSATATAAQVQSALIAAVNGDTAAVVTAAAGSGTTVNFTADNAGVAGNIAITYVFANSITPTKTGLTGGLDPVVVNSTATTLTGAATGAVTPLPETITVPATTFKNVKYIQRFEGTKKVLGSQPQAFLKGVQAYAALDALLNGSYKKFNYDVQYSQFQNGLTVAQMDSRNTMASLAAPGSPAESAPTVVVGNSRRAVLLSVAEFNRVSAGKNLAATLQSKQWLAYKAYRSFTRYFSTTTKVYAIYNDTYVVGAKNTKVLTKTVVAYLMLESYYEYLRG